MALKLKQHGVTRVRPLHGGIEAWIARGYPVAEARPLVAQAQGV